MPRAIPCPSERWHRSTSFFYEWPSSTNDLFFRSGEAYLVETSWNIIPVQHRHMNQAVHKNVIALTTIPVGFYCRINPLHFCREVRPPPRCVLDMTLNHPMARMQPRRNWGMWHTLSLPLFPSTLQSGVVAPFSLIYESKRTNYGCKQMTDVKLYQ